MYTYTHPSIIPWLITSPIHLPIYAPFRKTITLGWIDRKLYASNITWDSSLHVFVTLNIYMSVWHLDTNILCQFPHFFQVLLELRWLWVQLFQLKFVFLALNEKKYQWLLKMMIYSLRIYASFLKLSNIITFR